MKVITIFKCHWYDNISNNIF